MQFWLDFVCVTVLFNFPGHLTFPSEVSSASEVTTLWRYTNLFIIIIIIYTPGSKDPRG